MQQHRSTRLKRLKALLQRYGYGALERIVFSDEKLFVIEEHLNAQNYRVYAGAFEYLPEHVRNVQRFQKPGSVMFCGSVTDILQVERMFCRSNSKCQILQEAFSILRFMHS
jgi:hypothetical protein